MFSSKVVRVSVDFYKSTNSCFLFIKHYLSNNYKNYKLFISLKYINYILLNFVLGL